MLAGFVAEEVILVDVHHQELVELHVLVALQGRAVAGPAQPLEVDAETLRELRAGQTRALRVGGGTREHSGPEAKPTRRGGGAHLAQFQLFNERGPLVFHLLPIRRPFGFDLKSERQRSAEFLEMKHLGTATDRVALHLHSAGGDLHLRKELSGPVNRESFSLF